MSSQITSAASIQSPIHLHGNQVLSRQEAKLKLHRLVPYTEEHSKLQAALIGRAGIVEISLPDNSYRVDTSSENCVLLGGFGASEHVAIGSKVKLHGLPENSPLLVKGAISIQFKHIVALAGDYYGVVGKAISLPGGSDEAKTMRFMNAFNTLAQKGNEEEVAGIVREIEEECRDGEQTGTPHHCYSSHMIEKNNAIKKIKSDIEDLLIDNSDHFSENAFDAYRIGHAYAMQVAREAGSEKDLEQLKLAYALDAFACHFLTDLFAAGHIRNQRGRLESFLFSKLGFSLELAKKLAGLLTGAQHELDGKKGLEVTTDTDKWLAFGDGFFFSPQNEENRKRVIAATQESCDEIFRAYSFPDKEPLSKMSALIPKTTPFNHFPLYVIEEDSLFLYHGSDKKEIKTRLEFSKGISLAVKHLPESYINGFVKGLLGLNYEFPPLIENVALPQLQRLTGSVWRIVGIATFHHTLEQSQIINDKTDEMALLVRATHNQSEQILQQMDKFDVKLGVIIWEQLIQELTKAISTIQHKMHELSPDHMPSLVRQKEIAKDLWDSYISLSCVLEKGTAHETQPLQVYTQMLKTQMPENEVKIAATLWFRKLLNYQVQAVRMCETLLLNVGTAIEELRSKASHLESSIPKQVDANKAFINSDLAYENQDFILLQLEKTKIKRLAFSHLIAPKEGNSV